MDRQRFEKIFVCARRRRCERRSRASTRARSRSRSVVDERAPADRDGDRRRRPACAARRRRDSRTRSTRSCIAIRSPPPRRRSTRRLLSLMTAHGIDQVPLLRDGRVVDVAFMRDLVARRATERGRPPGRADGRRARHPAASAHREDAEANAPRRRAAAAGDGPRQVRDAGFSRVLIAVNYRAEVIEEHFGDGSQLRCRDRLPARGASRSARRARCGSPGPSSTGRSS